MSGRLCAAYAGLASLHSSLFSSVTTESSGPFGASPLVGSPFLTDQCEYCLCLLLRQTAS